MCDAPKPTDAPNYLRVRICDSVRELIVQTTAVPFPMSNLEPITATDLGDAIQRELLMLESRNIAVQRIWDLQGKDKRTYADHSVITLTQHLLGGMRIG